MDLRTQGQTEAGRGGREVGVRRDPGDMRVIEGRLDFELGGKVGLFWVFGFRSYGVFFFGRGGRCVEVMAIQWSRAR